MIRDCTELHAYLSDSRCLSVFRVSLTISFWESLAERLTAAGEIVG